MVKCVKESCGRCSLFNFSKKSVENCRRAMELAQKTFDIPMVLEPEYLASPYLDDLSGMTYLSYFMRENSPGFFATLRWVNSQIPQLRVKNFTVIMKFKDFFKKLKFNFLFLNINPSRIGMMASLFALWFGHWAVPFPDSINYHVIPNIGNPT